MTTQKPIVLLGEARGAREVEINSSFVGASGIELLRMLSDAGVLELTATDQDYIYRFWKTGDPMMIDMVWRLHPEFARMNVFNFHPPGNDLKSCAGEKAEALVGYPKHNPAGWIRAEFAPELERLADELVELDPNLIVALGNTPLWALCGTTGISKVRGTTRVSTHTVDGFKVLPTYHPAAVLRQWELRPTTVADLIKAGREAAYAELRRPARHIWIEPTLEDLELFYDRYIAGCDLLSVDIETAGTRVTCIGFAPSPEVAIVIPFYDGRAKKRSYWPTLEAEVRAWHFVERVLADRTIAKLFQNGLYDIAFNWRSVGLKTLAAEHDTMLLHHALQPEALKGLGYLGSVYTNETAWKTERKGTSTIKRDE